MSDKNRLKKPNYMPGNPLQRRLVVQPRDWVRSRRSGRVLLHRDRWD